ncbi:hypothetical protein GCK72_001191 [Caenorhabditis remanei]|uniref:Uncharacterized protein n=1 Tax=Caenorhabditis remanei TaxID=31234 RepID=A0A6A5HRV6_CAERE|nr:hypothetical protein GCK72_001191 [Caenorhabditis remanei]KAF1769374.1 hypothetical protein GCK72_001191 [Caenorhabditis remanei]
MGILYLFDFNNKSRKFKKFEFSAISPLHHRLVKSTPNLVSSESTIDVQLSETIQVSVVTKKEEHWDVGLSTKMECRKRSKNIAITTRQKIEMKIVRRPYEEATVYTPSDLDYVIAIANYLSDLFKTSFGEIVIDIQEKEISEVHLLNDNSSDGMDIVRKDGLLATIVQRDYVFKFLVWHERFSKDDDVQDNGGDEEEENEDDDDVGREDVDEKGSHQRINLSFSSDLLKNTVFLLPLRHC